MKFTLTSFPSVTTESFFCPSSTTTFPSNLINGVSYLLWSSGFNTSPFYGLGYMISSPLPWSIINIFTKNPPICEVTTKASLCGYDIPSRSPSSKVMGSLFTLSLFSSQSTISTSDGIATLNMPLWRLTFTPMEVAWITSIIPKGGGSVLP